MKRVIQLAAPLLALLYACDEGRAPRTPNIDLARAQPIDHGVLFLDEELPRGYLLDLERREPAVEVVPLSEGQRFAHVRPPETRGQIVILTTGEGAGEREGELRDEVRAELSIVSAKGVIGRYSLPGRFNELTLSDDGRYAVAYAPTQSFALASNVALVDLDRPAAADNPLTIALTSLDGQPPERFVFSPELKLSGEARRFLFTLSENYLNLVDLAHPERGDVTVELALPNEGRTLSPEQILFDGSRVYVRSRGSDSVLVMQLTQVPLAANRHGFEVSLLTLPAGDGVTGMTLTGRGAQTRLLAFTMRRLVVFDPTLGAGVPIEVGADYVAAQAFRGAAPNDDVVRERLVLISRDDRIAFIDGVDASSPRGLSVEEMSSHDSITSFYALPERDALVLNHDNARVSLVDLVERTIAPLELPDSASQILLDAQQERLWIAFAGGRLGTLALRTRTSDEILLDARAENVLLVPGDAPKLVALHASRSGFATVLDAAAPSRDSATALLGFFWNALLDPED